jgi:hypothetical protein
MHQGAKSAEHHYTEESTAAADNHREQDSQHSSAGIGLMRPSKADAAKDEVPYSCDQTATKRDNHDWKYRPAGKTNYSECRFKRLLCAAYDH